MIVLHIIILKTAMLLLTYKLNLHLQKCDLNLPFLFATQYSIFILYITGLPAVITLAACQKKPCLLDDVDFVDACKQLEAAGADVVGLNCARGPDTILPILEQIKDAGIKVSSRLQWPEFM